MVEWLLWTWNIGKIWMKLNVKKCHSHLGAHEKETSNQRSAFLLHFCHIFGFIRVINGKKTKLIGSFKGLITYYGTASWVNR